MQSPTPTPDLKARLATSYDAIAQKYNTSFTQPDDPIRLDYLHRLLSHLKSAGGETASVLELGCGAGIPGTQTLLKNESPSISVTANDLSSAQIEFARANLSEYADRLTLVGGDMMALDFPSASLDAVVGFYSIIHLPRTEQTQLVKKIAQWLKLGGLFLANFSTEEMPEEINKQWLGEEKGWMYWSGWGEEGSVKMVEEAGLEVLVREVRQADAPFVWVLGRKR